MKKLPYWLKGGFAGSMVGFLISLFGLFRIRIFGFITSLLLYPFLFLFGNYLNRGIIFYLLILIVGLIGIIAGWNYNRSESWNNKSAFISFLAGIISSFVMISFMFIDSFCRSPGCISIIPNTLPVSTVASLIGFIFGITGLKSQRRNLAIIGLFLSLLIFFSPYLFSLISILI
jgi:hypothetical protein